MGLTEYQKKRNFRRTPEPSGRVTYRAGAGADALSYVIQKHDASHLHYDFRLELGGVLKSWAVPKGPSLRAGVKRLAMETEDHPMEYGGFEGVIPKGQYGGGTVMLWDRGVWIPDGDPARDYERGRLRFRLEGEKLSGSWILTRMKPKPGEKKASWLLIKSSDAAARGEDDPEITEDAPLSVETGRGLEEIAEERDAVWNSSTTKKSTSKKSTTNRSTSKKSTTNRSRSKKSTTKKSTTSTMARGRAKGRGKGGGVRGELKVQLATLVREAPAGEEWVHELKLDGYRVLVRVEDGRARVVTRNGKDWTASFPGIAEAAEGLEMAEAVVDGEVVVMDRRGISSFQMLQNSLSGARAGTPLLYAFDLLHLDGVDLRDVPLVDRKAALAELLEGAADPIRYSDHLVGKGPAFFERACRMGVEGIISKRANAPYRSGRGRDWRKVKCTARQEFVVVGYTEPSGSRVGLGALLLAVHDGDGRLVYAGKVGTGFDTRTLETLEARLAPMERKSAPVVSPPRGAKARGVHWVRPELVAEIEFTEWTDDGRIRHPSFQGLREDKSPEEVVREEPEGGSPKGLEGGGEGAGGSMQRRPGGASPRPRSGRGGAEPGPLVAGVKITSPDRVLWSGQGVTKGELFAYYEAVADVMLPQLVDRPLTLVRCPSGADEKCFYQKHAKESIPDVVPRVNIEEAGGVEPYMYVNGLPSLIALVQIGVLEFHVWGSRRDRLDRPDRLVFDLDPDEELAFGAVARAALDLRERLSALGLESFVKSTGGKGLHVVAPVTRRSDWEEARAFTQAVARAMVADEPDRFTAKMTKSRRTGRIFVDYLRNARNATAIADYSTRARPGAPVAVPLAWDEVSPRAKKPPSHSIRTVPARVAERLDPWAGYDDVRQSITVEMKKAIGVA